jgi:hypothetical protein
MTVTHIIMLVGIALSALVALVVASQQRKQMRQVELYKQDPSVGLVPPRSAVTRFIQSKWDVVLGFGGPILNLFFVFIMDTPLTRLSVLVISLSVALLLVNIVMTLVFRMVDRMSRLTSDLTTIVKDHFEITKSHSRILENMHGYTRDSEEASKSL